jgi:hypothetical protein
MNFFVQVPTSLSGPNSLAYKTYTGQPFYDANNMPVAATFYGWAHSFRYTVLSKSEKVL